MTAVPPIPELKTKVGDRFGRLTVTHIFDREPRQLRRVLAVCDCGKGRVFTSKNLRLGRNKSCGCGRGTMNSKPPSHTLPRGLSAAKSIFRGYQRAAKKRGHRFELDIDEFMRLTQYACAYCGSSPSTLSSRNECNGQYLYNGIDRIDNKSGYIKGNMNPCCKICNHAKADLTLEQWMAWLDKIGRRHQVG